MIAEPDEAMIDRTADRELLLYDYFKHLTSLSIIALGGVLAIAQSIDPASLERWKILTIVILISGGGIGAFHGASEIVRIRALTLPVPRSVEWMRRIAPLSLAGGVGMFLSLFLDALKI